MKDKKLIDRIYDEVKNDKWFKDLSMDAQGEFCLEIAEQIKNVSTVATQAAVQDFFRGLGDSKF